MGLAFVTMFSPLSLLGGMVQALAGLAIWAITIVSLCVACYVVVRHPYLSLIDSTDGDVFSKYFASGSPVIYKSLNFAALAVALMIILSLLQNANNGLLNQLKLVYVVMLMCCLLFTAFIYRPNTHPTFSTFLRATVGVGLLFFPIFLPALIVGAFRCRRLLEHGERGITM